MIWLWRVCMRMNWRSNRWLPDLFCRCSENDSPASQSRNRLSMLVQRGIGNERLGLSAGNRFEFCGGGVGRGGKTQVLGYCDALNVTRKLRTIVTGMPAASMGTVSYAALACAQATSTNLTEDWLF
ncbi:hypothetical protein SAMN05518866_103423 [Sphingobium sp. YR768]|nr:hypothetical protein SAMN05518866_103423 [Sphingobium sp. YR768]